MDHGGGDSELHHRITKTNARITNGLLQISLSVRRAYALALPKLLAHGIGKKLAAVKHHPADRSDCGERARRQARS